MQFDIVNMTPRELDVFAGIVWKLRGTQTGDELRREIIRDISELLHADFVSSYIWNDSKRMSYDGVSINIEDKFLKDYEENGQPYDIVTPEMRKKKHAAIVDEVIDRRILEKSVHYNDFLKPTYMHHGINVYFFHKGLDVGDLRIYRGVGDPKFTEREVHILNLLKPYFESKLSKRMLSINDLTKRESEVARCILAGLSDKEISNMLNISFTTVRTHIKNIMEKLKCKNRTEVAVEISKKIID